jgi:magnesium chelatase family protein
VPAVKYEKLSDDRLGEPSAVVRARVEAAREIQRRRFEGTAMACNAASAQPPFGMGPAEIRQFCRVDEGGRNLIKAAMQQLHLSARAYHRVLKLARTIADLAGSEQIQTAHSAQPPCGIAEAIQYRPRRQV